MLLQHYEAIKVVPFWYYEWASSPPTSCVASENTLLLGCLATHSVRFIAVAFPKRKSTMRTSRNQSATSALVFMIFTCLLIVCASPPASAQSVPLAQHVVLVIDENTSFNSVYPSGMNWLVSEGKKYGSANNYYSDVSGSLLDYLYLASGSCESDYQCGGAPVCGVPSGGHNLNCNGNVCNVMNSCVTSASKDPITDDNIFHLMNNQPLSWKVYVQNYLNAGGTVNVPDFTSTNQPPFTHYYARHNAAVWYEEILSNVLGSQGNIVDFEQFGIDVANNTLPRFS